jgi:hypothetical protein
MEALDTYGLTPLHRMTSHNLAAGAQALLHAGANPAHSGTVGEMPRKTVQSAGARDVIAVLRKRSGAEKGL